MDLSTDVEMSNVEPEVIDQDNDSDFEDTSLIDSDKNESLSETDE